jgi:hypothetical protein
MINFLSDLFTANKHFHMTWMRANPIHEGHVKVANAVVKGAGASKAEYAIILSNAHDGSKNPLPQSRKSYYAKKAFRGIGFSIAEPKTTILNFATKLYNRRVTHLHIYVGSDRQEHFKNLLNKYNGVKNGHGYYKFKKIIIHVVGGNRRETEGVNSYSGSKMREAALNNDSATFHSMAPIYMRIRDINDMFNDVQLYLKLKTPK